MHLLHVILKSVFGAGFVNSAANSRLQTANPHLAFELTSTYRTSANRQRSNHASFSLRSSFWRLHARLDWMDIREKGSTEKVMDVFCVKSGYQVFIA